MIRKLCKLKLCNITNLFFLCSILENNKCTCISRRSSQHYSVFFCNVFFLNRTLIVNCKTNLYYLKILLKIQNNRLVIFKINIFSKLLFFSLFIRDFSLLFVLKYMFCCLFMQKVRIS